MADSTYHGHPPSTIRDFHMWGVGIILLIIVILLVLSEPSICKIMTPEPSFGKTVFMASLVKLVKLLLSTLHLF